MAKDPAFLFYPGDYLRDTQCLSEKSQVAYDRIMCEHMRNICISKEQLNFFTKRLTEEEKREVMSLLISAPGGFQIEWVAISICKRKAYSKSRSENRTKKPKNISKSYDHHMENENENTNEDINRTEIENFLVPEMFKKFKKNIPTYPGSIDRDYKPLLSIAKFLMQQGGLQGSLQDNTDQLLIIWEKGCQIISEDNFYRNKSLSTISNHIQEIVQIGINGKSNSTTKGGKPVSASSAFSKIDRMSG